MFLNILSIYHCFSVDGSKGGDILKFGQPFALASVLGNVCIHIKYINYLKLYINI